MLLKKNIVLIFCRSSPLLYRPEATVTGSELKEFFFFANFQTLQVSVLESLSSNFFFLAKIYFLPLFSALFTIRISDIKSLSRYQKKIQV